MILSTLILLAFLALVLANLGRPSRSVSRAPSWPESGQRTSHAPRTYEHHR